MRTIFIRTMLIVAIMITGLVTLSAQLKVNASGDTYALKNFYIGSSSSNFLGTNGVFPLIFKVNNVLAGFTGNSASNNVSFGYGSLLNSLAGTYNTAIGFSALYYNGYNVTTPGTYNTAVGTSALYNNTSGSSNTATGAGALLLNTTGTGNTATGNNALNNNTIGNYNTAVGYTALYGNTTGNYNTAIGCIAGFFSPDSLSNTVVIGYAATATSNGQVVIGNSIVSQIGGYANWSNLSDGRAKKNIQTNVPGLDFINLLQPVTYNLDLDAMDNLLGIDKAKKEKLEKDMPQNLKDKNEKAKKDKEAKVQTGFVAQDVEKTAKSIGYDFSGVNVDEKGVYSLSYAEFVVPLVKAVQELSAQNEQLQQQIDELKGNGATLRSSSNETGTTGVVNPEVAQCKLYQNAPNPFTQDTNIRFYIPENVNAASLNIYDLQGKQLMQIPISQRGESSQVISGHHFSAGMYLYALITDETVVDTKRMILTK